MIPTSLNGRFVSLGIVRFQYDKRYQRDLEAEERCAEAFNYNSLDPYQKNKKNLTYGEEKAVITKKYLFRLPTRLDFWQAKKRWIERQLP